LLQGVDNLKYIEGNSLFYFCGGCRGRDHMVVGFTSTRAISAYHH